MAKIRFERQLIFAYFFTCMCETGANGTIEVTATSLSEAEHLALLKCQDLCGEGEVTPTRPDDSQ